MCIIWITGRICAYIFPPRPWAFIPRRHRMRSQSFETQLLPARKRTRPTRVSVVRVGIYARCTRGAMAATSTRTHKQTHIFASVCAINSQIWPLKCIDTVVSAYEKLERVGHWTAQATAKKAIHTFFAPINMLNIKKRTKGGTGSSAGEVDLDRLNWNSQRIETTVGWLGRSRARSSLSRVHKSPPPSSPPPSLHGLSCRSA